MPDFVSTMVLGSDHCLMVSHVPHGVEGSKLSENYFKATKKDKASIEKFGLFGSDIDYNTYFPDVTPAQFQPENDEFIEPMFRLLSNCIVAKNYMPTEFPADVLKESMPLLVGQTVNCDHETNIGNAIGSIKEVFWQDAYKLDGKTIPGGINGLLKIDGKANPRIARGINMDPPSIHSNSVTVQFTWKPSHDFENPGEFWDKIGTYDDKGEMIRRIVTKIISYKETSLVSHGADPFAQKLNKEGKIINPGYADSVYNSFSEDVKVKMSRQAFSNSFKDIFSNSEIMYNTSGIINRETPSIEEAIEKEVSKITDKTNLKSMNELEQFLEQLCGEGMISLGEGVTPTAELVLSSVRTLIEGKNSLAEEKATLENSITSLTEEVTNLKAEAEKNQALVKMGKDHFAEVKEATVAAYKKTVGEGKEDANILTLIEGITSLETLVSFKKTYDAQLEEKFPLHCADCGSKNINRGSSIKNEGEDHNSDKTPSTQEVLDKISKSKR